jgi:2-iminoacetate synthase ThiH
MSGYFSLQDEARGAKWLRTNIATASERPPRLCAFIWRLAQIQRRVLEAWDRGAVEVCLQGGIHPAYTGSTYLAICRAIKEVCPKIHIHETAAAQIR